MSITQCPETAMRAGIEHALDDIRDSDRRAWVKELDLHTLIVMDPIKLIILELKRRLMLDDGPLTLDTRLNIDNIREYIGMICSGNYQTK